MDPPRPKCCWEKEGCCWWCGFERNPRTSPGAGPARPLTCTHPLRAPWCVCIVSCACKDKELSFNLHPQKGRVYPPSRTKDATASTRSTLLTTLEKCIHLNRKYGTTRTTASSVLQFQDNGQSTVYALRGKEACNVHPVRTYDETYVLGNCRQLQWNDTKKSDIHGSNSAALLIPRAVYPIVKSSSIGGDCAVVSASRMLSDFKVVPERPKTCTIPVCKGNRRQNYKVNNPWTKYNLCKNNRVHAREILQQFRSCHWTHVHSTAYNWCMQTSLHYLSSLPSEVLLGPHTQCHGVGGWLSLERRLRTCRRITGSLDIH